VLQGDGEAQTEMYFNTMKEHWSQQRSSTLEVVTEFRLRRKQATTIVNLS
jgi:hypothetical protein